ncbi:hypothetical protein VNO78_05687 [Psophocarpus tetragonolobus]|uniref:Uncharacterized protein n=1 Tax=Psophocarpus tetragonolobus TaxID=3891 RepID=A0AAN9STB3_PSOTE
MDNSDSALELEEFEIYNSGGRSAKKKASSSSVPVNIPDWSKILGDEYLRRNKMMEKEEDYDVERVPPHEFLAKTRWNWLGGGERRSSLIVGGVRGWDFDITFIWLTGFSCLGPVA